MSLPTRFARVATCLTWPLLFLAACGKPPGGPPPATGTRQVGVVDVRLQDVVIRTELPGRTSPFVVAEVRPQVGGLIKSRPFREGSDVKAGELLYQIEPATFRASVASAEATLGKAEASVVATRLKSDRYRELEAIQAVSKQDADDASATLLQGQADVASAKASLDTQRIALAWTRVTAPISGRIGKSSVTPGALVTTGQTAALATIQQLDPMYVDITQASSNVLRLKRALADGALKSGGADSAKVRLLFEDGTPYASEGVLQFSEVTVDQSTNSVTLRAVFPNPRHELLPGLYVRAVLEEGVKAQAVLAPQAAVTRDEAGRPIAYVVGADSKIELRALVTDRAVGADWLVSSGLKPGDRLVVQGLQNARPGVAVQVSAAAPASAASPGSATAVPARSASAPVGQRAGVLAQN